MYDPTYPSRWKKTGGAVLPGIVRGRVVLYDYATKGVPDKTPAVTDETSAGRYRPRTDGSMDHCPATKTRRPADRSRTTRPRPAGRCALRDTEGSPMPRGA